MKTKILIVSNNDENRSALVSAIRTSGYEIHAPEEVSFCTEMISSTDYHKIIVDYNKADVYSRIVCNCLDYLGYLSRSIIISEMEDSHLMYRIYKSGGHLLEHISQKVEILEAIQQKK